MRRILDCGSYLENGREEEFRVKQEPKFIVSCFSLWKHRSAYWNISRKWFQFFFTYKIHESINPRKRLVILILKIYRLGVAGKIHSGREFHSLDNGKKWTKIPASFQQLLPNLQYTAKDINSNKSDRILGIQCMAIHKYWKDIYGFLIRKRVCDQV